MGNYVTWNFIGFDNIPTWVAAVILFSMPIIAFVGSIIYLKLKGEITFSGLIKEINW